jgi:hypothetical protein
MARSARKSGGNEAVVMGRALARPPKAPTAKAKAGAVAMRTRSHPELETIFEKVSILVREKGTTHVLAALEQFIEAGTNHKPSSESASEQPGVHEAEAMRWKKLRAEFLDRYRSITAPELAEITGSRSKNPSSRAHEWLRAGKIFSVNDGGVARYPLFQLDPVEGKPLPEIQEALAYLRERLSDWQIAMWFTTPNTMAGNWRRPIDLLGSESAQVVKAAAFEVAETAF